MREALKRRGSGEGRVAESPASRLAEVELARIGARADEMSFAKALADSRLEPKVYDALSPRMRRLIDLIGATELPTPDAHRPNVR
jgi:hypothetical protein